jgi:hypothetical protein
MEDDKLSIIEIFGNNKLLCPGCMDLYKKFIKNMVTLYTRYYIDRTMDEFVHIMIDIPEVLLKEPKNDSNNTQMATAKPKTRQSIRKPSKNTKTKSRKLNMKTKIKKDVTSHLKRDSKTWNKLSKEAKSEAKDDKKLIKKVKKS